MASSTVFLDLLGPQRASEKGTTCPGPLDQLGVGGRGQVARAGGALLGRPLGAEQVEEDGAGGHRSLRP